jgi:glutamine synthetase
MNNPQQEVLRYVEENDVKFIRLAFCDLYGRLKNISIQPGELIRAFDSGIPIDASAVRGFSEVQGDLNLIPDPTTLSVLPWRPQSGRVIRLFCDLHYPDGKPYANYGRTVLRHAVEKAGAMGYRMDVAAKCEFYLFEADEKGHITLTPQDRAGYLDVAPYDKGENVRREICLALEAMHIQPESSHHEQGPGQNEIDFRHADALTAADQLVAFKDVVRAIAAQNGLCASFLPKPLPDKNGNGQHMNLYLFKDGLNLFRMTENGLIEEARYAVGGLLGRVKEISLFCNPVPNSYQRLGSSGAPGFVSWSFGNRSHLIRIPVAMDQDARMELRSPDPATNPYLLFALILEAVLDGIKRKAEPGPALQGAIDRTNLASSLVRLPVDLGEAIVLAQASEFLRDVLPPNTLDSYISEKKRIWIDWKDDPQKVFKKHFETI